MKIITLITDFGTSDYFVGAMKGAILSVDSEAHLVDITHEITPQNIELAAFTLFAAHQTFPSGTIHLAVVDPGVGSARRAIAAMSEKYFFVAPDNGLLSFVYDAEPSIKVFNITNERFFRHPVSATFHGRDVFAPIAGALSRGVSPAELGEEISDFVRFEIKKPKAIDENTIEAEIFHIDRFGNCLVNLKRDDLPQKFLDRSFLIEISDRKIERLQNFYAEAEAHGELFMIFGSAGFLELVSFKDSAAKKLGVERKANLVVKCC
ncbi:MAG: SAM-dependent chlorinase/fluorinase [Acidobacteriota bacterium]|nr:SAM-dependent chlorinase/fluorinase [Acidobacteriota bacterium]